MDFLSPLLTPIQAWIFEVLVQPALYTLGLMAYAEAGFEAVEGVLYGLFEIGLMVLVFRTLEAWRPAERWPDRHAVRTDVLYSFLHRLGILPLLFFVALRPLVEGLEGGLRLVGYIPPGVEDVAPALTDYPLVSFLVYLMLLDLAEYWRHRLQHRFPWWWALHAVHHSQRQLSYWSDRRNHVLDDLIANLWFAVVALIIGVPTNQFIGIVVLTRLAQSLSHANVRLQYGALGNHLLVSPMFHRQHHGIGVGHEGAARGCNFAPLFPLWDVLFGTANFTRDYPATGIRDQLDGRDYGRGFLSQQWIGLRNAIAALRPPH